MDCEEPTLEDERIPVQSQWRSTLWRDLLSSPRLLGVSTSTLGFLENLAATLHCTLICICPHFNYNLNVCIGPHLFWDCTRMQIRDISANLIYGSCNLGRNAGGWQEQWILRLNWTFRIKPSQKCAWDHSLIRMHREFFENGRCTVENPRLRNSLSDAG